MQPKSLAWGVLVAVALTTATFAAACGSDDTSTTPNPSPTVANAPPTVPAEQTATPAGQLSPEVRYYARQFGLTDAEAVRRLDQVAAIDTSALEVPGKTLATWIEHEPDIHIVVAVIGEDIGLESAHAAAKLMPVPVEFRFGASYTQEEINGIANDALASLGPDHGVAGLGYLPREGHILVNLQPFSPYANQDAAMSSILTAQFGFPFRVETSKTVAGDD